MLDVLHEAGIRASGVDANEAMVARCRARGHAVEHADLLTFLRNQADGSVPALFSSHVVEHLTYDDLIGVLRLSVAKLEPGGQLIFETPNPHALDAFKTFWTDPTHRHQIFPEVALAFCWLVGFERAYVMFPNGTGDLKSDTASQGEYAVIATKSA
jgi:O-antigen chain-terminating methyltransferase